MITTTIFLTVAGTLAYFFNTCENAYHKSTSQNIKTHIEYLKPFKFVRSRNKLLSITKPDLTHSVLLNQQVDVTLKRKRSVSKNTLNSQTTNKELYSFDKNTCVNLSKNELKSLGIFIKDDVLMYEMKDTKIGNIKFCIGNSTDKVHRIGSSYHPSQRKPLALIVTNVNGDDLRPIDFSEKYTDEYIIRISSKLLPVWVEDLESLNPIPYIVWFELNDSLNNFLPKRILKNLSVNRSFYSHQLTDRNKRVEKVKYHKQNIAIDKNQIVIPSETLLTKLGFRSITPIVYFRQTDKGGQLSIDYHSEASINIGLANQDNSKESIPTVFPVFLSSYNPIEQSISDVTAFRELAPDIMTFDEAQDFNNKKLGLIGLWIKGDSANYIFWYDYNPALLKEFMPEDQKRILEYYLINKDKLDGISLNTQKPESLPFEDVANNKKNHSSAIKTITLNKIQLEKLAIKVENNKIVHKIYLGKDKGKPSALQNTYDKYGSTSTYPINFENYDTLNYMYPVMLTDDFGQYARATINYGKAYDLVKITSYNLIPILVRSGEEYTTIDQLTNKARPDIIFWYEPTEKFLKILDPKTADGIRNDVAALECHRSKITFITDSSCKEHHVLSCNYFEACENSKSKAISKYSVFPNPANDRFNLKLDLKEECSVHINMFALNGTKIKQFALGNINKGISQKELSSEGVIPGLYLIRITTDKGDIFNERILIKK